MIFLDLKLSSIFLDIILEFPFFLFFSFFSSCVQNVAVEKPVEEVKVISDIVKDSHHKVLCSLQKITGLQFWYRLFQSGVCFTFLETEYLGTGFCL
jgi:hypothetical protein